MAIIDRQVYNGSYSGIIRRFPRFNFGDIVHIYQNGLVGVTGPVIGNLNKSAHE